MADAAVTWKLSPSEARRIRSSLEVRADDAHEHAREVRTEDAPLSRALVQEATELKLILEKI